MSGSDIEIFSVGTATRRACALHCSALLLSALTSVLTLAARPATAQGSATPGTAATPTLLVVGDSLSAEYGLARGTGWVALLTARLAQEKRKVKVVNASISGDTTSGGRSRLPALLALHKPQTVVIELGGNDALRGLSLPTTQLNLDAMARAAKAAGA